MPEELRSHLTRRLQPGDVVMVSREMTDKRTGRPYDWKFFMVVTEHKVRARMLKGIVISNSEKFKDQVAKLTWSAANTIHYLSMEEWPEGVSAFRMSMVLRGLIPDIV